MKNSKFDSFLFTFVRLAKNRTLPGIPKIRHTWSGDDNVGVLQHALLVGNGHLLASREQPYFHRRTRHKGFEMVQTVISSGYRGYLEKTFVGLIRVLAPILTP